MRCCRSWATSSASLWCVLLAAPLPALRAEPVVDAQLEEAVRSHLERVHADDWSRFELLEVRFTNGAPAPGARLGAIEGDADPTPNGSLLLSAELTTAGGTERLPLSVLVKPWVRVPVAARALARGTLLGRADLALEERPLAELRGSQPIVPERGARLRARRDLRRGEPLTTAAIEEAPAVRSGSRVVIRLESGRVRLTTAGIARRAGRVGEEIPVENTDTRRVLVARVVDEQTVEVLP